MSVQNVRVDIGGPKNPSDLTYKTVILKSNLSFASQIGDENTKYVVRWNYDLGGQTITMPAGCILHFDGGVLTNGTIVGNQTYLAGDKSTGDNITASLVMEGTWKHNAVVGVDSELSLTSPNPVENRVVAEALANKVDKEANKGLSTNDFTDHYKELVESATSNSGTITGITMNGESKGTSGVVDLGKVATLNDNDKLPNDVFPDWVDDVIVKATRGSFDPTGLRDVIYIAADTNIQYRWDETINNYRKLGDTVVDTELSDTSTNPVENRVVTGALNNKVDAVPGKGLSTNDYSDADKTKLQGIESGAQANVTPDWNATSGQAGYIANKPTIPTVDANLSNTSINPVQNKAITNALNNVYTKSEVNEKVAGAADIYDEVTDYSAEGTPRKLYIDKRTGLLYVWRNNGTTTGGKYYQIGGTLDSNTIDKINEMIALIWPEDDDPGVDVITEILERLDALDGGEVTPPSTRPAEEAESSDNDYSTINYSNKYSNLRSYFNNTGLVNIVIDSAVDKYLKTYYDEAQKQFSATNSSLFNRKYYPEIDGYDTVEGLKGTNKDTYELAFDKMTAWLMAMCLTELKPTKGSTDDPSKQTNNQTIFFQRAYAYNSKKSGQMDDDNGRSVRLYDNYEIHCDPMIARLAAAAVYVKVRGSYEYPAVNAIRAAIGGQAITTTASKTWDELTWEDFGTTYYKNGSDIVWGQNLKAIGYLPNTDFIITSAPGPYSSGNTDYMTNQPVKDRDHVRVKPWDQGQDDDQFYLTTGYSGMQDWWLYNYKVDVAIDNIVCNKYQMSIPYDSTDDFISSQQKYWKDGSKDLAWKKVMLGAVTAPSATSVYWFTTKNVTFDKIQKGKTGDDGVYRWPNYGLFLFTEGGGDTASYTIEGPFSDLESKIFKKSGYPLQTAAGYPIDTSVVYADNYNFLTRVLKFGDHARMPSFYLEHGRRRRPQGNAIRREWRISDINTKGTVVSGSDTGYGDFRNGIVNESLSGIFAEVKGSAQYPNEGKWKYSKLHDNAGSDATSYPSGHASQTMALALMLGQMFGGRDNNYDKIMQYIKAAYMVGTGRAISRYHWNSDIMYGRLFGSITIPLLNAMRVYMEGINSPYRKVRTSLTGYAPNYDPDIISGNTITIVIDNQSGVDLSIRKHVRFVVVHNGVVTATNSMEFPDYDVDHSNALWTIEAGTSDSVTISLMQEDLDLTGDMFAETGLDHVLRLDGQYRDYSTAGNIVFYDSNGDPTIAMPLVREHTFDANATYTINYLGGSGSGTGIASNAIQLKVKNNDTKTWKFQERIGFRLAWDGENNSKLGPTLINNKTAYPVVAPGETADFGILSSDEIVTWIGKNLKFCSQADLTNYGRQMISNVSMYVKPDGSQYALNNADQYANIINPQSFSSDAYFVGGAIYTIKLGGSEASSIDTTGGGGGSLGSVLIEGGSNPNPTPEPDVDYPTDPFPVITLNLIIRNNKSTAITLQNYINFVLENPTKDGIYYGIVNGRLYTNSNYNRVSVTPFATDTLTIAANGVYTGTFRHQETLGGYGTDEAHKVTGNITAGLGGRNFINPADLHWSHSVTRNVLLYNTAHNSSVYIANNVDHTNYLKEGDTIEIVIPA